MTEAEILERLNLYLTAERKILEGNQGFTIAGVTYERANISWVQREIASLRMQLEIIRSSGSYGCQQIIFGGRR